MNRLTNAYLYPPQPHLSNTQQHPEHHVISQVVSNTHVREVRHFLCLDLLAAGENTAVALVDIEMETVSLAQEAQCNLALGLQPSTHLQRGKPNSAVAELEEFGVDIVPCDHTATEVHGILKLAD